MELWVAFAGHLVDFVGPAAPGPLHADQWVQDGSATGEQDTEPG